jgi:hypothetical protein
MVSSAVWFGVGRKLLSPLRGRRFLAARCAVEERRWRFLDIKRGAEAVATGNCGSIHVLGRGWVTAEQGAFWRLLLGFRHGLGAAQGPVQSNKPKLR